MTEGFINIKVEELSGKALRYAVLHAIGWDHLGAIGVTSEAGYTEGVPLCKMGHNDWWRDPEGLTWCAPCEGLPEPDRDWNQCGPLIDRFLVNIGRVYMTGFKMNPPRYAWNALSMYDIDEDEDLNSGYWHDDAKIAACRAIVASVYGDTARVPAELVEDKQ